MEVLSRLLLLPAYLKLESWQIDPSTCELEVTISSTQATANCPVCQQPAYRIHSHYERSLADLPWGEYGLRWQLQVRKFFCLVPNCDRRIFTERLPGVVAPWARKTQRLLAQLTAIGLFLGGAAGERLARWLGLNVSRQTLLRLVFRQPLSESATPTVLGVDDWAFRKGRRYGTILVDLATSRPVALLPDREAETLAKWLKEHPGVEVIARDRSQAYEKGSRLGAPQAIQVSDRFHLLRNLAETLEQVFSEYGQELKAVEQAAALTPVSHSDGSVTVPISPSPAPKDAQVKAQQRRDRRLATFQQVWDLRQQGWSGKAIATKLGIGKSTVFRYLRSTQFPERKQRSDRGFSRLLAPFKAYLLERWNAGCREVKQLFHQLQSQGYQGSYTTVTRYIKCLAQAQGLAQQCKGRSPPQLRPDKRFPLTVRRATWLVMRRAENRDSDDEQLLTQIQAQHPALDEAIKLTQEFTQLVRNRSPEQLDSWLLQAMNSQLTAFQRFAQRLAKEYESLKAGVTLQWSTGPVEGHINRLKTVKRQMYGRASLELLRHRFLPAA